MTKRRIDDITYLLADYFRGAFRDADELRNFRDLFFFSSRRRHTRSKRDWSSDVCSSDLRCHGRRWPARDRGAVSQRRRERRRHRTRDRRLRAGDCRRDLAQLVRAVLHDSTRGHGPRPRHRQALRRGDRRSSGHRQSDRPRYDGAHLAARRQRRRRAGSESRMSGSTVLKAEDEQTLARSAKAFLADHGYEAEVAASGEKALELLESLQPDVIFADVRLPGMSGIDLLKRIREFDPVLPVIML